MSDGLHCPLESEQNQQAKAREADSPTTFPTLDPRSLALRKKVLPITLGSLPPLASPSLPKLGHPKVLVAVGSGQKEESEGIGGPGLTQQDVCARCLMPRALRMLTREGSPGQLRTPACRRPGSAAHAQSGWPAGS